MTSFLGAKSCRHIDPGVSNGWRTAARRPLRPTRVAPDVVADRNRYRCVFAKLEPVPEYPALCARGSREVCARHVVGDSEEIVARTLEDINDGGIIRHWIALHYPGRERAYPAARASP
jgi:hypothetical protein